MSASRMQHTVSAQPTSQRRTWPVFIGLLGVMKNDAESVPRPPRDRAHAVTHRRPVPAARAARRSVSGGEDDHLTLLGGDRLAPRLRARPLLDEEEVAALVIHAPTAEERGDLERKGDVAVEVLVQAVVAADLVVQEQRRGLGLAVAPTHLQQTG